MRFAPPNPLRIAERSSGLNALSVRGYNERLVLSLLLQNETTTRLEIGEKTGLSAQTISVIVRSLEQEGLVMKGEAQKGRVGPPTTPIMLNPDGAFSIGVSVGHHNTHVVLVDFVGNIRFHSSLPHRREGEFDDLEGAVREVSCAIESIPPEMHARIAGIGVGIPAPGEGRISTNEELHQRLETDLGLPVYVQNDIAAAAAGESLFGVARTLQDFLFFYLGPRLHSRLVLNHQIYNGNSPISRDVGVSALERALPDQTELRKSLWQGDVIWPDFGTVGLQWRQSCAEAMIDSIRSLSQFIEIRTVILSSFIPRDVCSEVASVVQKKIPFLDIHVGRASSVPKAVGAASLPFSSRFMVD
ncbi:MAG: ROK family protein [Alphaproteobacteria bacterium]|nr:ROK family protein [Alphaproteobacteria bacterium]